MLVTKLLAVGNSIACVVPVEYRRKLGWKRGELVYMELGKDRSLVLRSLHETLETKRKAVLRGAGDVTQVNRKLRLPRD